MNKWPRIKSKIYEEKLGSIAGVFTEVFDNINNTTVPRSRWTAPVENWTKTQIQENKLSLEEYLVFKGLLENLNDKLRGEDKHKVIREFKKEFKNSYLQILEAKENDLKLEVSAELIEESQFPIEIFAEWYSQHCDLPPEQFNEELGSFWGDVWNHAKQGAGYGALAGGVGGGSFAGAGLGGLAGGVAGGLYGGGKHLLKRVWQYRQTQRNFEETKQKALESLKKLKELSKGFEMNPNFTNSLDTMIDQLGTARAYRVATRHDPEAATEAPAAPTKSAEPGGSELAPPVKAEMPPEAKPEPAATPTPAASPTASSPMPTPKATPAPAPAAPPTAATPPVAPKAAPVPVAPPTASSPAPVPKAAPAPAPKPAPAAPPVMAKPPEAPPMVAPKEPEKAPELKKTGVEKINDPKDIYDLYKKAKDAKDTETLSKMGAILSMLGADGNMDELKHHIAAFDELWSQPAMDFEDKESYIPVADKFADKFKEDELAKSVTRPGSAEVMPTKEKPVPMPAGEIKKGGRRGRPKKEPVVEPTVAAKPVEAPAEAPKATEPAEDFSKKFSEDELYKMKLGKLKRIAHHLHLDDVFDADSGREDYVSNIMQYYATPKAYDQMREKTAARKAAESGKKESAMERYGKILHERKLAALPLNEKVGYLKSLLSSRGS